MAERGLAAIGRNFPQVWAIVERTLPPTSSVVDGDDGPENIDLGRGNLYPAPAREWTRRQLSGYAENPDTIYFSSPAHCNISPFSKELLGRLTAYIRDHDLKPIIAPLPVIDVGFLWVLGVGLGYHLPDLIANTKARHVVLIEPYPEFLVHAAHAIDWEALFETAESRDITIHFVLETKPEDISRVVEHLVIRRGNTFLDGSTFCLHYYAWGLEQAYASLKERLKHLYISVGFFEDEMEMMRNTHENVKACSFHLLEGRPHLIQSFPVFIVGSGPSLDNDLAHIRKWRDKALVISCGTALRILLKNGIRPDLHCENERVELVRELIGECEAEYGLDGITLVATTTMFPDVAERFERRWFYYRDALSPAILLNPGCLPLHNADPLVCNAAFAAATFLGFQNIYLFGMDLGSKRGAAHHAKDAVYNDPNRTELDDLYVKRFEEERIVPGNFGGRVQTFWAFDMGRRMLGEVQRVRGINLFNCSDGARIPGARPQKAAGIDLGAGPADRQRVLRQVTGEMRYFDAGQILEGIDLQTQIDGLDTLRDEVRDRLARLRGDGAGFWEIAAAMKELDDQPAPEYRGTIRLVRATMRSMVRMGAFFGNRLNDEAARAGFVAAFLDEYEERCMTMIDEARELLCEIEADRSRHLAERGPAPAQQS